MPQHQKKIIKFVRLSCSSWVFSTHLKKPLVFDVFLVELLFLFLKVFLSVFLPLQYPNAFFSASFAFNIFRASSLVICFGRFISFRDFFWFLSTLGLLGILKQLTIGSISAANELSFEKYLLSICSLICSQSLFKVFQGLYKLSTALY